LKTFALVISILAISSISYSYATVENGALTQNSVEWCTEVYQQYNALGLSWFLENYHYSIESRVCANLYEDSIWNYDGNDRMQKLVERSKYYVDLEIRESEEEAQSGDIDVTPAGIDKKTNSVIQASVDGTIFVTIQTTDATAGDYMGIDVIFKDSNGKQIPHVNYDLKVVQKETIVLVLKSQYAEDGITEHWTRPLSSDKPVDIEVKILGIGLPENEENWTGYNEVITFQAVPEFGKLALAILMIQLLIIVIFHKFRLIRNF
jgi:hypothetical protein